MWIMPMSMFMLFSTSLSTVLPFALLKWTRITLLKWALLLAFRIRMPIMFLTFIMIRAIFANKQPLLICLLIEFQLIQFNPLFLALTLELPQSFQSCLWFSLTFLNFFAIFDNCLSKFLSDHTFDYVLTIFLSRWTISKEIVFWFFSIKYLNLYFF